MTAPARVEIVGHPMVNAGDTTLAEAVTEVRCPDCACSVELDTAAAVPTFRVGHSDGCPRWRHLHGRAQTEERARAKRERKAKARRRAAREARKRQR